MKKDYDSTRIYRNTKKKGASQTYDTPSLYQKSKSGFGKSSGRVVTTNIVRFFYCVYKIRNKK